MLHENENLYALNGRAAADMYAPRLHLEMRPMQPSYIPEIIYMCYIRTNHSLRSQYKKRDVINMHGRRPFIFPHILADKFNASGN
jgi:hypothetical protein